MDNPFFNDPKAVENLSRELREWEGTPIIRLAPRIGARKRMGGNCVTIVHAIMKAVGACPPEIRLPQHNVMTARGEDAAGIVTIESFMESLFTSKGLAVEIGNELSALITGDILAFKMAGERAHHLGIYSGAGWFYHAGGNGLGSTFRRSNFGDGKYGNKLYRAWRLLRRG